jgi:hypothetical protein
MRLTPSIFAYSMLYPYADNYLDDPSTSLFALEPMSLPHPSSPILNRWSDISTPWSGLRDGVRRRRLCSFLR